MTAIAYVPLVGDVLCRETPKQVKGLWKISSPAILSRSKYPNQTPEECKGQLCQHSWSFAVLEKSCGRDRRIRHRRQQTGPLSSLRRSNMRRTRTHGRRFTKTRSGVRELDEPKNREHYATENRHEPQQCHSLRPQWNNQENRESLVYLQDYVVGTASSSHPAEVPLPPSD